MDSLNKMSGSVSGRVRGGPQGVAPRYHLVLCRDLTRPEHCSSVARSVDVSTSHSISDSESVVSKLLSMHSGRTLLRHCRARGRRDVIALASFPPHPARYLLNSFSISSLSPLSLYPSFYVSALQRVCSSTFLLFNVSLPVSSVHLYRSILTGKSRTFTSCHCNWVCCMLAATCRSTQEQSALPWCVRTRCTLRTLAWVGDKITTLTGRQGREFWEEVAWRTSPSVLLTGRCIPPPLSSGRRPSAHSRKLSTDDASSTVHYPIGSEHA
jgi:hypothetical protein